MKYLLSLLLLVPFLAFADARIELDTGTCHIPWSPADADLEYKLSCQANSLQHADGTYTAWFEVTLPDQSELMIDKDLSGMDSEGEVRGDPTNCATTAGTFVDDNGTAYTTANCVTRVDYRRTQRDYRYDIYMVIRLDRAAAATATAAAMSEMAGTSIMAR